MITLNIDDANDKDEIQCLFKEIYELLESKFKFNEENITEFKNSVEKIHNETNDEKTNLVLVGDFNSGKTTCCNALIASLLNDQFKPWTKFDDFLPSSRTENTYFITVVESSDTNKFYLEHYEDDKLIKKIAVRADDVEEIKTYLLDLDNRSNERLREIAEIEVKRREDPNFNEKVPRTLVKVMIPGFSEKFRIIDVPGMTSTTLCDDFFHFLQERCLVNIFLIIRSLIHTKVSDAEFVIATNNIISRYPNSLSLLILTKVDGIIEETDNSNLKKYQDNLKEFLTYFGKKSKSLKNLGTYVVSCIKALEDIEIYKNGVIKLKNHILDIEQKFSKSQKIICLLNKLRYQLEKFNSRISSDQEMCFNDDEYEEILMAKKLSCEHFKCEITNWLNDLLNYKIFEKKYVNEIKELHIKFQENDEKILKNNKYAKRNTYIVDQIKYLSTDFQTQVIESTVKNISINSVKKFMEKIKNNDSNLLEKINKYLRLKDLIDDKINDSLELSLKGLLGTIAGIAVASGIRAVVGLILVEEIAIIGGVSIIPVVGWVAGAILGIGCTALTLSNYIGIWKRANCFEDTMKIFYDYLNNVSNQKDLLIKYGDNFDTMLTEYTEFLKNMKKDNKITEDLRGILKKCEKSIEDNEMLKSNVSFNIRLSIEKGIESMEVFSHDYAKVNEYLKVVINQLSELA